LIITLLFSSIFRIGGTVGAVLTCPLEVVKTRLQSSVATFQPLYLQTVPSNIHLISSGPHSLKCGVHTAVTASSQTINAEGALQLAHSRSVGLYYCLRWARSLFEAIQQID